SDLPKKCLNPIESNDLISLCYIRLNRLEANSGNWDQALMYSQKGLENATVGLDSNYMGYALLDFQWFIMTWKIMPKAWSMARKLMNCSQNLAMLILLS